MRQSAIIVFGVIPAFILCILVLVGLVAILGEYLGSGNRDHLITLVWCALCVIGTMALYFSIDDAPGPITMIGLFFGIAGMIGLDGLSIGHGAWKLFFIAPMVTAGMLIIEGLSALSNRDRSSDEL